MTPKKIHFAGIGGVGMAALAVLLKAEGHAVTGCDIHASPRTRWLESLGIPVSIGHAAEHVNGVDILVVTPAVHADNPDLAAMRARGGEVKYRGEVLAALVSCTDSVAVSGSHGKTTTSTFTAKLLRALGENVAWAIGGETGSFPVASDPRISESPNSRISESPNLRISESPNSRISESPNSRIDESTNRRIEKSSPVLVVEADESDGTLAGYHARTLVVTNCEYDHPDHFKTRADYVACFDAARRNAADVIEGAALAPIPEMESADWFRALPAHNRANARTAAEVALRRGHALAEILAALPAIVRELPDRRFETLAPGVVTDYAHHPTEMKCAVRMARAACRGKLRVLFQPHRHSRTKALLADFPAAFAGADEVILCPTYAAFEPPVEGGDIADLYKICRESDVNVFLARSCEEAWYHAKLSREEGALTLLLGAGDIINLAPLVTSDAPVPRKRIWIGAGSNTWKSDLKTGEEYARTTGPADRPGATLGIPWMAGIPGTIGGWLKMNAGAFGHSISEVVKRVKVDGRWLDRSECGFGYRTSSLAGEIQDAEFEDEKVSGEKVSGEKVRGASAEEYLKRRKKFPAGTKGSVFKNPEGDFAGRLLEAAGVKGMRVGGAYVWDEHANVIVAGPGSRASDFLALARLMHERVRFRLGIDLEPEVSGLQVR